MLFRSKVKVKSLSHVRLLGTPWTAVHQAPPPKGFSRKEYWSGVPLPPLNYHDKMLINEKFFLMDEWHPTPVLLPGKSYGRRSLVDCSPWDHKELDTTERLHFHFSFLCIGEGNGNPLQCSYLENPRDRRAWWAAISGVAQSDTTVVT